MTGLFAVILEMSFAATLLIFAVLIVRALSGRAPKWIRWILWGMVAIRLVCPFTPESSFSLIPQMDAISEQVQGEEPLPGAVQNLPQADSAGDGTPLATQGYNNAVIPDGISESGSGVILDSVPTEPVEEPSSAEPRVFLPEKVVPYVWIFGVFGMLGYCAVSYSLVYRRMRDAVCVSDGIYESNRTASAFVLGFVRPRVYLPEGLPCEDRDYVLTHELAHIKGRDYLLKPFGFFLLALHWFNPAVWLAFYLFSRDIEFACDERVIRSYGVEQIKGYSTALVNCGVGRRTVSISPLAFGEVGVMARVKAILHYKKPTLWIMIASLLLCVGLAVCFLTSPRMEAHPPLSGELLQEPPTDITEPTEISKPEPTEHRYTETVTAQATCTQAGSLVKTCEFCGDTVVEEIPELGHQLSDATCLADGVCARCSQAVSKPLGHTLTAATCTTAGSCTRCGAVSGQPLGHDATEATCTSASVCSRCGEFIRDALGHSFNGDNLTEDQVVCKDCGVTPQVVAIGDSFEISGSDAKGSYRYRITLEKLTRKVRVTDFGFGPSTVLHEPYGVLSLEIENLGDTAAGGEEVFFQHWHDTIRVSPSATSASYADVLINDYAKEHGAIAPGESVTVEYAFSPFFRATTLDLYAGIYHEGRTEYLPYWSAFRSETETGISGRPVPQVYRFYYNLDDARS